MVFYYNYFTTKQNMRFFLCSVYAITKENDMMSHLRQSYLYPIVKIYLVHFATSSIKKANWRTIHCRTSTQVTILPFCQFHGYTLTNFRIIRNKILTYCTKSVCDCPLSYHHFIDLTVEPVMLIPVCVYTRKDHIWGLPWVNQRMELFYFSLISNRSYVPI